MFEAGDSVRVVEGPFANFSAKVEEVKADKQKVKVLAVDVRPHDVGRA